MIPASEKATEIRREFHNHNYLDIWSAIHVPTAIALANEGASSCFEGTAQTFSFPQCALRPNRLDMSIRAMEALSPKVRSRINNVPLDPIHGD